MPAVAIGSALATFTVRSPLRTIARQVGVASLAAAVTDGVGRVIGAGPACGAVGGSDLRLHPPAAIEAGERLRPLTVGCRTDAT